MSDANAQRKETDADRGEIPTHEGIGPTIGHAPTVPLDMPPDRIGRYAILRLLGKGGMGVVYLAEDTQLGRKVALKVPNFAADEKTETLERFYREARTAARLQHPHICPVFDVDRIDGRHVLSMAYIEGSTLADLVPDFARRPPADAAALVRTLALALEEAHKQGIIHRDLKPSNVMINRRGEPVVMDFGLAREIRSAAPDLSQPGVIMGTPAYMAPEQARGDVTAMGPGCDVYSLGVVLYHLLVGELPFQGTTMDILASHIRDAPPPLSSKRPDLDPRLEAICLKAMAKEPSERFLSMAEFAQALKEFLDDPSRLPGAAATCDPFERGTTEALLLLRTWGWETGLHKVRERLHEREGVCQDHVGLFLRWIGGEAVSEDEAREAFGCLRQYTALHGWALLGQVFVAKIGTCDPARQAQLLDRVERVAVEGEDCALRGMVVHQRGALAFWRGRYDEALRHLHQALEMLGRDHFVTGRILDTLGMVYWGKNNFDVARELYQHAIHCKKRFGDDRSLAITHGLLGLLYLDWGLLDEAHEQYQVDLQLAQKSQEEFTQALACNRLGQIALARGLEESQRRGGVAHKHWKKAAEWLDASIRGHQAIQRDIAEAFARKDRALLCLAQNDLPDAEEQCRRAGELFRARDHKEGLAKLRLVEAKLLARNDKPRDAVRLLREAITWLDDHHEPSEAARAQLEVARTMQESGEVQDLVTQAYLNALRRAEDCRREKLVRQIEEELRGVDEEAHAEHVLRRVRGRAAPLDTSSLSEGESETATTLALNLAHFISFCETLGPGEVMRTLNQVMHDLGAVLEKHGGFVTAYLGGGFMALVRGHDHALRAVQAALDLAGVVEEFNRPRAVLGLRQLPVRIGVATGVLFIGNIGTYRKMDFTAVGPSVNVAFRLMRKAEGDTPCISRETWELVRDRFEFSGQSPRTLDLPEIGQRDAWDVIARKKEPARA